MTMTIVIAAMIWFISFIGGGIIGEYVAKKHFLDRIAELEHQVELKTVSERMWYNNYLKIQEPVYHPEVIGNTIIEPEQVYENEESCLNDYRGSDKDVAYQQWLQEHPEMGDEHYPQPEQMSSINRDCFIKPNDIWNDIYHLKNTDDVDNRTEDKRTPGSHQP